MFKVIKPLLFLSVISPSVFSLSIDKIDDTDVDRLLPISLGTGTDLNTLFNGLNVSYIAAYAITISTFLVPFLGYLGLGAIAISIWAEKYDNAGYQYLKR